MKKILLFIFLFFIGLSYGYSQYTPIQIVEDYDDAFLRHLPRNQMVYCKDSDAVYMLDAVAFPISSLVTTANHKIIASTLDTTGFVMWSDTLTDIATKHDVDTLSNSVYDSLGNHYDLIHDLDTGKVSTSGDNMYGDLIVNAEITATDTIKAPYLKVTNEYTLPTTDGTSGQGIVTDGSGTLTWGMSFDSLECYTKLFIDSVESCITQLYLKADTTTLSARFKLQTFSSVDRPVLTVKDLSGNIDTTETIDIETTPFGFITITDSLNIGGVTYYNYGGNIIDDESITFPLNSYGFGNVYVFNAGMKVEYCRFILNIDGSFELQDNSANVEFSNVDGNVCLYSNAIQNRLGGIRYFIIELKKN
jgi:hypothetical protein